MLDLVGRKGEITQMDIDDGEAEDCELCPLALALHTMIPGARAIYVDCYIVEVSYGCLLYTSPSPRDS